MNLTKASCGLVIPLLPCIPWVGGSMYGIFPKGANPGKPCDPDLGALGGVNISAGKNQQQS